MLAVSMPAAATTAKRLPWSWARKNATGPEVSPGMLPCYERHHPALRGEVRVYCGW